MIVLMFKSLFSCFRDWWRRCCVWHGLRTWCAAAGKLLRVATRARCNTCARQHLYGVTRAGGNSRKVVRTEGELGANDVARVDTR